MSRPPEYTGNGSVKISAFLFNGGHKQSCFSFGKMFPILTDRKHVSYNFIIKIRLKCGPLYSPEPCGPENVCDLRNIFMYDNLKWSVLLLSHEPLDVIIIIVDNKIIGWWCIYPVLVVGCRSVVMQTHD